MTLDIFGGRMEAICVIQEESLYSRMSLVFENSSMRD